MNGPVLSQRKTDSKHRYMSVPIILHQILASKDFPLLLFFKRCFFLSGECFHHFFFDHRRQGLLLNMPKGFTVLFWDVANIWKRFKHRFLCQWSLLGFKCGLNIMNQFFDCLNTATNSWSYCFLSSCQEAFFLTWSRFSLSLDDSPVYLGSLFSGGLTLKSKLFLLLGKHSLLIS